MQNSQCSCMRHLREVKKKNLCENNKYNYKIAIRMAVEMDFKNDKNYFSQCIRKCGDHYTHSLTLY